MTSATYRQQVHSTAKMRERDPDNRLLARESFPISRREYGRRPPSISVNINRIRVILSIGGASTRLAAHVGADGIFRCASAVCLHREYTAHEHADARIGIA